MTVKSFIRLTRTTILNYFKTTKNILFVNVSALEARVKEHHKEVDSITEIFTSRKDQGSQYLQQICNYRSCLQQESWDRLGERQGDWSRIRQSWQTYKGGNMDQKDGEHESTRGQLPTEPRMGQAFTYWRLALEVSPDEGFRHAAVTSINSMFLVVLE